MTKLKWETPPAGRRAGGAARIDAEVEALKARPGKWAKLRDGAASGNYITYKKRGLMTRVKSVGDNHYDIWACWYGSKEEPAEITAEQLTAGVVIIMPKSERVATITDVTPLEDGRLMVQVLDGTRDRKLQVKADRELTSIGIAA